MQINKMAGGLWGIGCREDLGITMDRAWRSNQKASQPLSLALIEIDFFRQFQLHCGIAACDECLEAVAVTIMETARQPGASAYVGGTGQFSLLLPNTDSRKALRIANEIHFQTRGLVLSHPRSPVSPFVSVSVGVATAWPALAVSSLNLLDSAEDSLRQARQLGRDQVVSSDMHIAARA